VLVLAVYALTLARGAYPGQSALLEACVADLLPDRLPAHPIWMLLAGWVAQVPLFSLALRLNLFSAICAAASVGLLGLLMERWLFRVARDPRDGTEQMMRPEDEEALEAGARPAAAPAGNPASAAHNLRAASSACFGGWVAALALAFSVPFWSVATRLHFQSFDLLLLLTTLYAAQAHFAKPSMVRALIVALLCGLGCVETAIFVPLSPLIFLLLLRNRLRVLEPWRGQMMGSLILAVIGALAGLLLLWRIRAAGAGSAPALWTVLVAMLRAHYAVLRHALPESGWIWMVLLAYMPAATMLPAAKRAFSERSPSMIGMQVALTVATVLCLFNAPVSPWVLARNRDDLPVMACLAVAAATGYLAAYWRMLRAPMDRPDAVGSRLEVVLSTLLAWPLAASVVVAAGLNLGAADGRNGAFADILAQGMLDRLGTRTWMISDGVLDNHILIRAREQGRPLHLVSLADGMHASRQHRLQGMIGAEPAFAARRVRLCHAVALGPMAFAQEWLTGDPMAESRLLVAGVPEVWTLAGYRPVPDGLGYNGARSLESLRGADLLGSNRAAWLRMERLLASDEPLPAGAARVRAVLRREAGLSANNLGVLLEDLARPDEAYEAYEASRRIDPRNLSALFNQQALALGGTRAKERPALEHQLKVRLRQEKKLPPIKLVILSYGDIRQPAILQQYGLAWSDAGQPALARAQWNRALALAPDNTGLRLQLANLALRQDQTAEGERAFRAVLAVKTNDAAALVGMGSIAVARGRHDEARAWLERARQAGAPASTLAIPMAALLTESGRTDEALASLRALTDADAQNLEAWSLLAELLLRQKNIDEVEQRVLPAMVRAMGKGDHVLIHLVRANLLRARHPVDFAAARASLLCARKLRPDLAVICDDLLELDRALGDPATRERDAISVLRLDPGHAFANYLLAAVLLDRGELPRAEDLFRRSLATQPTAMAHNDLAETLRRRRQLAAAEQSARAALELNVRSYAAWDTLGCVLLDAGRPDEAAQAVERSLRLCATDPRIHISLARVRLAQGRTEDVREILKRPVLQPATLPSGLRGEIAALAEQTARAGR
jgi:tetratricopeptide (TPR) repeat protein